MREYLVVLVVTAVVTFMATPLARRVAERWGAVTPVRGRDVHTVPIPRLGGIAMLIGLGAGLLVASQLPYLSLVFSNAENVGGGRRLLGVLGAAAVMCLLGVIDDFRELDALTKFAGQIIAAAVMAFNGVELTSLPLGAQTYLPRPILIALTIFIVVATTNAVNFIDGLDGLAAGVVGIAGITFFVYAYSQPLFDPPSVFTVSAVVSAILVGCCLGFLPHNFFPARLFMGDCGALLLGLLLSAATISLAGDYNFASVGAPPSLWWLPIVLPIAILMLPVLDILLAFGRRGLSFSRPDKKHLHHKMMRIGHTHRRAVLILYAWSFSVAIGVLSYSFLPLPAATSLLATLLAVSLVLTWGVPRWLHQSRL